MGSKNLRCTRRIVGYRRNARACNQCSRNRTQSGSASVSNALRERLTVDRHAEHMNVPVRKRRTSQVERKKSVVEAPRRQQRRARRRQIRVAATHNLQKSASPASRRVTAADMSGVTSHTSAISTARRVVLQAPAISVDPRPFSSLDLQDQVGLLPDSRRAGAERHAGDAPAVPLRCRRIERTLQGVRAATVTAVSESPTVTESIPPSVAATGSPAPNRGAG